VKVNQCPKDSEEEEEEVEDLRFLLIVMTIIWLSRGGLDNKIRWVVWAPKRRECIIFCSEKYASFVRCCVLLVAYQTRRNRGTSVRLLCGGYFVTHFISRVQTALLSSIDKSILLKLTHDFVSVIFSFQLNLMCIISALKDERIFTEENWSPLVAFGYSGWGDWFYVDKETN